MKSKPINKKYKVTIEYEITLDQVREYSDIDFEKFENLVQESIDDQEFIRDAANHIAQEVKGYHEEDEAIFFDYLDFTVDSYTIKTIEE